MADQDPFAQYAAKTSTPAADPFAAYAGGTPTPAPAEEEGGGFGGMLAGGAAALGAAGLAVAAKKYGVGPVLDTINNIRRQGMLSGKALPKSLSGNLGGAAMASIERESTAPLKEMLRLPTNAKNAVAAFKAVSHYQGQPSLPGFLGLPGRILGATDEAAQMALQRGGLTAEEAAKDMLQEPLGKGLEFLNNPLGDYLVPFRRTPANAFKGAFETMNDWSTRGKKVANVAALGGGAATGAATEDNTVPVFGAAAMGRRGIPFLAGALAGRLASGASKRNAADLMQGVSPVSDYSLSEGVAGPLTNPVSTFKPALWKLLFESDK